MVCSSIQSMFQERFMAKRIIYALVAVVAAVALLRSGSSSSVRAAEERGVLQGVVKNTSGAPVAGAFVKMKDAQKRLTVMVISQEQGRYTAHVPPGTYVVQGVG